MNSTRNLHRNPGQRVIAGVCSGIAEYLSLDPVIVRLVFFLLAVIAGGGVLIYVILWIILPKNDLEFDYQKFQSKSTNPPYENGPDGSNPAGETFGIPVVPEKKSSSLIMGIVLIVIGVALLLPSFFANIEFADLWPIALIAVGLVLLKPTLK